jgi:hypothetical protein
MFLSKRSEVRKTNMFASEKESMDTSVEITNYFRGAFRHETKSKRSWPNRKTIPSAFHLSNKFQTVAQG